MAKSDARKAISMAFRRWYGTTAWLNKRQHQLRSFPFCIMCEEQGRYTPATVADHVVPHHGVPELFWLGNLQSLCQSCHSRLKQSRERHGYAKDRIDPKTGWPLDPEHPANK